MSRRATIFGLLVLLLSPRLVLAWWDDAWAFRKPLTTDTTAAGAVISSSLDNATLLVRLHAGNFGYFGDAKADGSDIRFVAADDKTPLPFHIESWDPAAGMAFIWVKVPRLTAGSSENFFMYYGNPEAKAGSDPGASWDVNQALAYHFADGTAKDVTSYGNQPAQSTIAANPGSVIGTGIRVSGAESLSVPASPSLRLIPAQGLTLSLWINAAEAQANAIVAELADTAGSVQLIADGLNPYLRITNGGTVAETPRGTGMAPGSWHLLAAVVTSGRAVLYMDGAEIGAVDAVAPEIGGTLTIGASAAANGGNFLAAQLDELRVSNTARSPDWIRAQFANQGQEDRLLRYGEDTQKESGAEPSYFLITMQNVTADGWAVIGILAVMALMSWVVMISKVLTIRRVRKDNAAFIEDFRQKSAQNLAALDREDTAEDQQLSGHPLLEALSGSHDHYQSSTLYHLYHTGMREVRQRFAASAVGADRSRVLGRQTMDAIRATVDAANVRETQKLNSQMVLLTIAIAGGPFLGLLGTVVGVMITFAAIAASGDVNVNSIAPGIAAALAATVAGLGVAIPALFGYNYLASQIKEIIADDRVFIDEFTTRLAEQYR